MHARATGSPLNQNDLPRRCCCPPHLPRWYFWGGRPKMHDPGGSCIAPPQGTKTSFFSSNLKAHTTLQSVSREPGVSIRAYAAYLSLTPTSAYSSSSLSKSSNVGVCIARRQNRKENVMRAKRFPRTSAVFQKLATYGTNYHSKYSSVVRNPVLGEYCELA